MDQNQIDFLICNYKSLTLINTQVKGKKEKEKEKKIAINAKNFWYFSKFNQYQKQINKNKYIFSKKKKKTSIYVIGSAPRHF